uniref:Uncharacterized protein n=1 Tax=Tanacetum cinerariifolium TaxID=118510 RepID=A0A6L2P9Q1_TANCI|nr:hypothetical protein [Tanacetum cinerariifolium]
MCDKKNKVLFTDTDCLVLSLDFKLPDENQVLLKIPKQHNMYSFNLKNIDPSKDLSFLFAKALIDESNKKHKRLGHVHFKNLNKLAKGNLVRGLPLNIFKNDHTCVACQKGKNIRPLLEKLKRQEKEANDVARKEATHETQDFNTNNTNLLNVVSTPVRVVGPSRALNDVEPSYPDDPLMPHLEDIYASQSEGIFTSSSYDDEGVATDFNNLDTTVNVSPTSTTRIHIIHPKTQILRDPLSVVRSRSKLHKNFKAHALWNPKRSLKHWKIKVGLMLCKRNCCSSKFRRGVVVRNKARLVAQGHRQEEGIDYDEVCAPVASIEAIRIFLAFASYMGFIVYQMDVKSVFLYGTIDVEVYVTQPPGFVDTKFSNKRSGYRRRAIDKTLFIKQDKKDIMLVQVYVDDIIFGSTKKSCVKTASTSIETQKPLVKDEEAADVDVHLYMSMVTPKTSHLQAVKRIFRYLKGQPKLGLWYPKASLFDLEAYSDSDYAGANLNRKSTTGATLVKGRLLEVTTAKQRLLLPSIELASPKQTALGKDESNPLMVDSLLKTIWSSMHHVIAMKHWLFQSKRLLVKKPQIR